jgi:hypothetical protein
MTKPELETWIADASKTVKVDESEYNIGNLKEHIRDAKFILSLTDGQRSELRKYFENIKTVRNKNSKVRKQLEREEEDAEEAIDNKLKEFGKGTWISGW